VNYSMPNLEHEEKLLTVNQRWSSSSSVLEICCDAFILQE